MEGVGGLPEIHRPREIQHPDTDHRLRRGCRLTSAQETEQRHHQDEGQDRGRAQKLKTRKPEVVEGVELLVTFMVPSSAANAAPVRPAAEDGESPSARSIFPGHGNADQIAAA